MDTKSVEPLVWRLRLSGLDAFTADRVARDILASDWLAARDARLLAEVEPEWGPNLLAMSPEDRAGWVALKRRAEAAEAKYARLRHDIEALAALWATRVPGRLNAKEFVSDLRTVLAAECEHK